MKSSPQRFCVAAAFSLLYWFPSALSGNTRPPAASAVLIKASTGDVVLKTPGLVAFWDFQEATGGASPGQPWCYEVSLGATPVPWEEWVCVGMTYDGKFIRSYLNGKFDAAEGWNPYEQSGGIFDGGADGADFVIGHSDVKRPNANNQFAGVLGGVAVFNRALNEGEMTKLAEPVMAMRRQSNKAATTAVFNEWVKEHNVHVFRNHWLAEKNGVTKDARTKRLTAIRCENGAEFRASVFIDATYEGDLLHFAGVSTVIGREANAKYGETKNGIRGENTYRQFEVRVDPYRIPGDPRSGLIPTIQDEPLGTPGAGDHRIQAYCFRITG